MSKRRKLRQGRDSSDPAHVIASGTVRYPHHAVQVRSERAGKGSFTGAEEDDSRAKAARVRAVGEPSRYATEEAATKVMRACLAEHWALSAEDDDE